MPSRRAILAAVATVSAGCATEPASNDETATRNGTGTSAPTSSPASTPTPVVTFERTDRPRTPTDRTVLVCSGTWRQVLWDAAGGGTGRARFSPVACTGNPLIPSDAVTLVDAGDRDGTYGLEGDAGGYYRQPVRAEPADPPDDATVRAIEEVPDGFADAIDGGTRFAPQSPAFQFGREHGRQESGALFVFYVERDGTTYRVFAPVQTVTPPCDYYAVVAFADEASGPGIPLSLADLGAVTDALRRGAREFVEAGETQSLGEYPDGTETAVGRFDAVLVDDGFFGVSIER